jgi:DNA (cytosine-5)-methyltransferase 1
VRRPKLLDLFCGAGGAGMGYHRAGFDVVGVDINPQPHYPFEFHQADAMRVLSDITLSGSDRVLGRFDAIHASPPCQGYSRMRHLPWLKGKVYPLLIAPVRERLQAIGVPWVIENVEDAPLHRRSTLFGDHGVLLCGTMIGLPMYRHRPFESSFPIPQPEHRPHQHVIAPGRMFGDRQRVATVSGFVADPTYHGPGRNGDDVKRAMGIDWMTRDELAQAIPPAYTEFIGVHLLATVNAGTAA